MRKNNVPILFAIILIGCVMPPQTTSVPTLIQSSSTFVAITPFASQNPPLTSTVIPTRTLMPLIATLGAAMARCQGDVYNEYTYYRYNENGLSPDKRWTAVVCADNEIYTKISDESSNLVWKLPALDTEDVNPGPEWFLEPYHWSADGYYLYLVPSCLCSIDSPSLRFKDGFGLYRLTLADGQLDTWFEPSDSGYAFSFSPDSRLFVFGDTENRQQIYLRNLISGTETILTFKEKYDSVGRFLWANDISELIIVAGVSGWTYFENDFSLFLYELHSDTLTLLIDNDERRLIPYRPPQFDEAGFKQSWISKDILLLSESYSDSVWELNIRTGELFLYPNLVTTFTPSP
jgi:hypothetical protein